MTRATEQLVRLTMALAVFVLCPHVVMAVGLDPVPEFYGADVEADVQRDSTSSPEFDQYIYTYKISNPSSNTGEIWYIKIDISEPVKHFDLPADPTLQLGASTMQYSEYRASLEPLGFPAGRNVIPIGPGGAPLSATATFPKEAVRFTRGEPKYYKSSLIAERGFCASCGSSLIYRGLVSQWGEWLAVRIASLDNPQDFPPTWHVGVESQMPWVDVNDGLTRVRCEDSPAIAEAWESVGVGCSDPPRNVNVQNNI